MQAVKKRQLNNALKKASTGCMRHRSRVRELRRADWL